MEMLFVAIAFLGIAIALFASAYKDEKEIGKCKAVEGVLDHMEVSNDISNTFNAVLRQRDDTRPVYRCKYKGKTLRYTERYQLQKKKADPKITLYVREDEEIFTKDNIRYRKSLAVAMSLIGAVLLAAYIIANR